MSEKLVNGMVTENGNHYQEIHHHYAEECSQDDIGTFLFTSESVGEGHPGINYQIHAEILFPPEKENHVVLFTFYVG